VSDVRQRAGRPDRAGRSAFDLLASKIHRPPLDRRKEWYRYHHLFRDMLLGELRRREPGLIPVLLRRAADWCLRNPLPEEALEYSIAAGDVDVVARLEGKLGVRTYQRGVAQPCSGGLGGLKTGAGSRNGLWSRCWPRSSAH
jgi:LuxR family maltose regulon positive regulatory protein